MVANHNRSIFFIYKDDQYTNLHPSIFMFMNVCIPISESIHIYDH